MRSVQRLKGTDEEGVEHLLQMAVENLKKRWLHLTRTSITLVMDPVENTDCV
jgi:hypothetical protein